MNSHMTMFFKHGWGDHAIETHIYDENGEWVTTVGPTKGITKKTTLRRHKKKFLKQLGYPATDLDG